MPFICDWHGRFLRSFSVRTHMAVSRFILERGLEGFPQLGKKCRIKFTLLCQMGRKKYRPKDQYDYFEIKYSKISLTTTLI